MAEQFIRITDNTGQPIQEKPLDLAEVKAKLAATNGQAYWRSLEEVAAQPGFTEMLQREFPGQAPKDWAPLPRREFVRLMGAALALAGLSGCAFQPPEKIVPYVNQPEELVPGLPLFYATAMPFMGYALGLLAESHQGRPTKLEGNPDHSSSTMRPYAERGATDIYGQAAILDMYDPDRAQAIRRAGGSAVWDDVTAEIGRALRESRDGTGVSILTGAITSPVLLGQIARIRAKFPQIKWHTYESINADNVELGTKAAFGRELHPVYHFDQADVIVSLDSNFLLEEPGHVRYARDFAARRRVTDKVAEDSKEGNEGNPVATGELNRLYVIESTPTITGAKADHRFAVQASVVELVARELAAALGISGFAVGATGLDLAKAYNWIPVMAKDLQESGATGLVVPGFQQPPAVHAIAQAINATLAGGAATSTVTYHAPLVAAPGGVPARTTNAASLELLVSDLKSAGAVKTLFILSVNPAYDAPEASGFKAALEAWTKANPQALSLHYGTHENETSVLCNWHVPEAHFLEYWGDVRGMDGNLAIIQPIVQPLYDGAKAPSEMLAAIAGLASVSSHDLLLDYHVVNWFRRVRKDAKRAFTPNVSVYGQLNDTERLAFDRYWTGVVHNGSMDGFAAPAVRAAVAGGFSARLAAAPAAPKAANPGEGALEVNFRPDPTIWDGRFANNPWLQELPKPMFNTVWDNAVFVAPNTAFAKGWRNNREVTVTVGGRTVTGAIHMVPGQPENTLTVHLGYGRTHAGKVGTGPGFNANVIRPAENPWFVSGAEVKETGRVYKIATTSQHNVIAPAGKDVHVIKDGFNPLKPAAANQTKIVDNWLYPDARDIDMDGTHGRDLVRAGVWQDLKDGKATPVFVGDKRGVPLAFPENPQHYQELVAKAHAKHGAHEGEAKHEYVKGGTSLNRDNAYGTPEGRAAEGFVSFYPRNSDPEALTTYKDASNNAEAAKKANADQRDDYTYAWGMTIDLQTCIGCNACVVACQSENNVAVVGKDQVLMGRSMHWIRIDTYFRGDYENPEVHFEPMACQHCEKAPCAPVCPFNAVMNSTDGINEQVYNRCVGTKYCENNCPYKVRRFNFLQYSDQQTPVIQLMSNPDVTVRSRGVMEKCTYCIQRVNAAKFQAVKEDRRVKDGEIMVACEQGCPTNAIVFGDINDSKSKVSQLKRGPLTFGLLTELNTLPRTSYLAKFSNPNPELVKLGYGPHALLGAAADAHGSAHGGGHGEAAGHGEASHGSTETHAETGTGHAAPSGGHGPNDGHGH